MAKITSNFKQAIIDDFIDAIYDETSTYYAFASHPIAYDGLAPVIANNVYDSKFIQNWTMMFGKKLKNTDAAKVAENNIWVSNTIYTAYDNTSNTLSNSEFYVITNPVDVGGHYHLYKCIDNGGNSYSTEIPDQIQTASFTKSDGYTWRYICSTSTQNYNKFASDDFFPVFANGTVQTDAYNKSGVEVIKIANTGTGYNCYTDGTVQSVVNSSVIQIENAASTEPEFYKDSGIFIYNIIATTAQLHIIDSYVSNATGNWVHLNGIANTDAIAPSITSYKISPQVVIDTDGEANPLAYTVVNTSTNSISNVVIIDTGYGITRANVAIVSNTAYGTGANVYAIAPPPGGHGSDPLAELNMQGVALSFEFANSELSVIPTNVQYNKIGIAKNIYALTANNDKGTLYTSNTFNNVLDATCSPSATFDVGELVTGNTSNAIAVVAFSNGSSVYLTGDKDFTDGEYVTGANGVLSTVITIIDNGDIYTKEIQPLYIQNIENLTRTNTQTESYKVIIQV